MKIREINDTDNRQEIAQLIYGTDPFIYPFWMHGVANPLEDISRLIDIPGSVSYRDNIYIAEVDDRIVGVMAYLHAGSNFSYDYSWERQHQSNFGYVFENYFDPTIAQAQASPIDTAVILNVCISPSHQGNGYGKQMFCRVADILHDKGFSCLTFDCLADNLAALKTYLRAGCKIISTGYGFNGFNPSQPPEVVFLEKRF